MKRILSILLVAILMAVSVPAFAENIRTSGDFEYKVRGNGTAEITGYIGEQTDIIIPTMMIQSYMKHAYTKEEKFSYVSSIQVP